MPYTTIDEIDFAELYRRHMQTQARKSRHPDSWNAKVDCLAQNLANPNNSYIQQFLAKLDLAPTDTLLDIGCGPGTIAIPASKRCAHCYGLDFNPAMLHAFNNYTAANQITNTSTILKSWHDDWHDVPQCDVVVASRSTLVDDLEAAINKMNRHARKKVYATFSTNPFFFNRAIINYLNSQKSGSPTYIYAINLLYKLGFYPELSFIQTENLAYKPPSLAELKQQIELSIGELTTQQQQGLSEFYQHHIEQAPQYFKTGQPLWALISWSV